jgi:hypothetical protein
MSAHVLLHLAVNSKSERRVGLLPPLGRTCNLQHASTPLWPLGQDVQWYDSGINTDPEPREWPHRKTGDDCECCLTHSNTVTVSSTILSSLLSPLESPNPATQAPDTCQYYRHMTHIIFNAGTGQQSTLHLLLTTVKKPNNNWSMIKLFTPQLNNWFTGVSINNKLQLMCFSVYDHKALIEPNQTFYM